MNYLIGILSVIFLGLAFAVISKSAGLSSKLKGGDDENSPLDSANNSNAIGFVIFWLVGTILGAWSFLKAKPDFLPEAASEHGVITDNMFWLTMAIITFAFFVTNTLLMFFAFAYRNKRGNKATFYPVNHKLEIIWTIIPAIVMAILVIQFGTHFIR